MIRINGATELYGIMGKPVAHSLSPAMHNAAFEALGLNKVYVPFVVDDAARALSGFRALGVKGVSVTIPHKQAVLEHLDSIDPVAAKIGAVNTLALEQNTIHGLNTDWLGANRALNDHLDLRGKTILLLGAGGSARAIGFGLIEAGAAVILASRTPARGRKLAEHLNCPWIPLTEAGGQRADALVNATSVGMAPLDRETPIPTSSLGGFPLVMDIVYSPLETRLLAAARAAGCTVVDGLAMLLHQGAAQFEIWAGRTAPTEPMRGALLNALRTQQNRPES